MFCNVTKNATDVQVFSCELHKFFYSIFLLEKRFLKVKSRTSFKHEVLYLTFTKNEQNLCDALSINNIQLNLS